MIKKTLGQLLIENKALTEEKFKTYQAEAKKANLTFARYIQEKKLVPQEAVAQAYATMTSLEYLKTITDEMADPLLLAKIPLYYTTY